MAGDWTEQRVLGLAPDSGSASAAQGLVSPRKWSNCGVSESALWGECQGSGKNPYQVRVDLSEPAFKCSCPSRKFPCKHGLALLLMLARGEKAIVPVGAGAPPAWVAEWLASRGERAEKKAAKQAEAGAAPARAADPEAAAKRAAKREQNVAAGLEELDMWMRDLVGHGFAAARGRPGSYWQTIAARMVDCQAPGLARMLRDLEAVGAAGESGGSGWQVAMLERLGRIHLLASAQRRVELLPEELRADVRAGIGWTVAKEEVLAREGVKDHWLVIGRAVEQEERPPLRVQRTWLWGARENRPALVLDFAVGNVGLDGSLPLGMGIDAELAYFPSAAPERALVKAREGEARPLPAEMPGDGSFAAALGRWAGALARCPWRERMCMLLRGVTPALQEGGEGRLVMVDGAGAALPVSRRFRHLWRVLAVSGGHPVHLAAEWDGRELLPLGVVAEGVFHDVGPRVGEGD